MSFLILLLGAAVLAIVVAGFLAAVAFFQAPKGGEGDDEDGLSSAGGWFANVGSVFGIVALTALAIFVALWILALSRCQVS